LRLNELSSRQIVIINVGMSTADGIPGPLFKDGTFRFVPIPESSPSKLTSTYNELGLGEWAPNPELHAHNDPEFETMTFGDYRFKKGKPNIRVANALKLRPQDFLFFFASLSKASDRRKRKTTGMFVIGFFEIREILPYQKAKLSTLTKKNVHRLRRNDSKYTVWIGTKRSRLLEVAVPMNRENVELYLRTSRGRPLPWDSKDKNGRTRTDLEVINSATRASRIISQVFRRDFWRLIIEKNPDLSVQ